MSLMLGGESVGGFFGAGTGAGAGRGCVVGLGRARGIAGSTLGDSAITVVVVG